MPLVKKKEDSIIKCIEYGWNNLSINTKKWLLILAPFRPYFVAITDDYFGFYFQQFKVFDFELLDFQEEEWSFDNFQAAIKEAIDNGLIQKEAVDTNTNLEILYLPSAFYFFVNNYINTEKTDDFKKALEQGFLKYYDLMLFRMLQLLFLSKTDQYLKNLAYMEIAIEYNNLLSAITIHLNNREPVINFIIVLNRFFDESQSSYQAIQTFQDILKKLNVLKQDKFKDNPQLVGDYFAVVLSLSNAFITIQAYTFSRDICENLLSFYNSLSDPDKYIEEIPLFQLYQNLGLTLSEYNLMDIATINKSKEYFIKAIELCKKQIYQDKGQAELNTSTFSELGKIYLNFGSAYLRWMTLEDLQKGTVTSYFEEAIKIFEFLEDYRHLGMAYESSALIFKAMYEFIKFGKSTHDKKIAKEALSIVKSFYSKAMKSFEKAQDELSIAMVKEDLALLILIQPLSQRKLVAREREFLRQQNRAYDLMKDALATYVKLGYEFQQAKAFFNLGSCLIYLSLEERIEYIEKALNCYYKFQDELRIIKALWMLRNLGKLDDSHINKAAASLRFSKEKITALVADSDHKAQQLLEIHRKINKQKG